MKKTLLVICALFVAAVGINATDYYLVGSMTEWTKIVEAKYTFVLNEKAVGVTEYMLTADLKKDDELKVVSDTDDWFPDGMGNNYVVAADGKYDIYFRPGKDGGEGWHEGCIYLTASSVTALDKAVVEAKAVKVVENGRIYIVRNGIRFNITGAVVE